MNNNEYLNTLSVDEKVEELRKMVLCDGCERNDEYFNCDGQCSEHFKFWLKAEHETTGHEDLVNAGWSQYEWGSQRKRIAYVDSGRRMDIAENGTFFYAEESNPLSLSEIDFLRKCADKIRKEKGWAL